MEKKIKGIRPGMIRSVNGVKPKLLSYRILAPLLGSFIRLFAPKYVITNRKIGKAMIHLVLKEQDKKTLESADMVSLEGKCNPVDSNGGILR